MAKGFRPQFSEQIRTISIALSLSLSLYIYICILSMLGLLFFVFYCIYLFMAARSLWCCTQAFPYCSEGDHSVAVVCGRLIVPAPLVVEHRLKVTPASVVASHRLSGHEACGIFSDQELNLCPLHWKVSSQPLNHQGSPKASTYIKIVPWLDSVY